MVPVAAHAPIPMKSMMSMVRSPSGTQVVCRPGIEEPISTHPVAAASVSATGSRSSVGCLDQPPPMPQATARNGSPQCRMEGARHSTAEQAVSDNGGNVDDAEYLIWVKELVAGVLLRT